MRVPILILALAGALLLAGCGGNDEQVQQARHKLHSTAATTLLLLTEQRAGHISARFATEHLRDARKALADVPKQLREVQGGEANTLVQRAAQLDQLMKDLDTNQGSAAAAARDVAPLQQLETELRDPRESR